MKCKKCKSKLGKESKYCRVCGEPVEARKRWPIVVAAVILIALLAVLLIALTVWGDAKHAAENGYEFNETVLEEIDASASNDVPTVREVANELAERGLDDAANTSGYDSDGTYVGEHELDPESDDRFPLYSVYYVTPDERLWIVYVCNGSYMANPFFGYESGETPVLLTEDDYVTSYISSTNTYVRSIPGDNEVHVIKVDRITAKTLDALDSDAIREGI